MSDNQIIIVFLGHLYCRMIGLGITRNYNQFGSHYFSTLMSRQNY